MYAIVDIETTGGNASTGAITEVAIILHNGREVEGRFSSLVNPQQNIPRYITALTGINDAMVSDAPVFADIAPQIFNLLENRIFIAHNVNFDYSFIHHHLMEAGISWQAKKVCTVRYARKVIPGLPSYSLGNICRHLGIENESRHRALGDAEATTALWETLLQNDPEQKWLQTFTKGRTPESYLPTNVPLAHLDNLPYSPGVYYFLNQKRKIIYVGKARNLKYRVRSHFANNSTTKRKQDFLRQIFYIEYRACATEMMAIILEELEIKKHWPHYNQAQKRVERAYGLYAIQDQLGFTRLAVERWRRHLPALYRFHKLEEGYAIGRKLLKRFEIEEHLLFATGKHHLHISTDLLANHNTRMQEAIRFLQEHRPTMLVYQEGEDEKGNKQRVYFWIEDGIFKGMGTWDKKVPADHRKIVKALETYADNEMVKGILYRFAEQNPEQVWQP